MAHKFIEAMQKNKPGTKPEVPQAASENKPGTKPEVPQAASEVNPHERPSRIGTKHIGGHFSPAVSEQLHQIAHDEKSSVQASLAKALDMFFSDRGLPAIASKHTKKKRKDTQ